MNRIAFTQRITKEKNYKEIRDCLDQNWINLAFKLNSIPLILPNVDKKHTNKILNICKPNLIVLTGGNDISQKIKNDNKIYKKRDDFELSLIRYSIKNSIPLIGICRGMQLINIFFEGKISKIQDHVRRKHKIFFLKKNKNIFTDKVNSFHNWGIKFKDLGKNLDILATDKENNIESFIHKSKKIIGIMWHPERNKFFNKKDVILFKKLLK